MVNSSSSQNFRIIFWSSNSNRTKLEVGVHNIINLTSVNLDKVRLPPLHIKLGLIKHFVKALHQDSNTFKYLWTRCPTLLEAKLKEVIFTGPNIRQQLKNAQFEKMTSEQNA